LRVSRSTSKNRRRMPPNTYTAFPCQEIDLPLNEKDVHFALSYNRLSDSLPTAPAWVPASARSFCTKHLSRFIPSETGLQRSVLCDLEASSVALVPPSSKEGVTAVSARLG
jgi:hypothetical protein